MMKSSIFTFSLVATLSLFGALEVSNVKLRQDWPWSNKIKLTYTLSGLGEGELAEVVVAATGDGKELKIPGSAMTGQIYSLDANKDYEIMIDPIKAFGNGVKCIPNFKISLTAREATSASTNVLYKIFDIKERKVVDVTRGALLNGEWGSVETDFGAIGPGYTTTLEDVVIWTGVTNDVSYKTSKIVVRKIPAGAFKGYKPGGAIPEENNMTWSFDYWIGVFEVTQAQRKELSSHEVTGRTFTFGSSVWKRSGPMVVGDYLPEQYVQNQYLYNTGTSGERKATSDVPSTRAGFFNYMRLWFTFDGVSLYDFELPTQVQWMRAMRAGADSYYYDGIGKTSSEVTVEQFNALACNLNNGGYVTNDDGSVTTNICEVGRFRPNAYGLYDMLGNVREQCRESIVVSDTAWVNGGENVIGTITNLSKYNSALVGGSFKSSTFAFGTAQVHGTTSNLPDVGFRVCMQAMEDGINLITPKTE